ncbi:cyclic nucleotide-binding domain-containing protein [Rhodobacterales bacterium HKCCSP123]|nr:cyclic nucleotide-binding domain-containing protein [Rhodobacterales bacterium HKCCSP123]
MMGLSLLAGIGVLGAAVYVFAYGALQLGFLRGSSVIYTVLNLIAASLVLVSLGEAFNLSSALIQGFWVVLSLIGLARHALLRVRSHFRDEETELLAAHFPSLPPLAARQMLRIGQWRDVPAGHVITTQGAPAGAVVYLAQGSAAVTAHGHRVATLKAGDLIGEITVIHNAPATAGVEMIEDGRIFILSRDKLLREMAGNHDFALLVGQALQIEAQRKIEKANAANAALHDAGKAPAAPTGRSGRTPRG